MMELSSVFNRIHFLLELKNASGDDRIIMLEYITPGQMACIGEIAHRINHHTFPLLIQDLAYFENRSLVLRVLFSWKSSHTSSFQEFYKRITSRPQSKIKYNLNENLSLP